MRRLRRNKNKRAKTRSSAIENGQTNKWVQQKPWWIPNCQSSWILYAVHAHKNGRTISILFSAWVRLYSISIVLNCFRLVAYIIFILGYKAIHQLQRSLSSNELQSFAETPGAARGKKPAKNWDGCLVCCNPSNRRDSISNAFGFDLFRRAAAKMNVTRAQKNNNSRIELDSLQKFYLVLLVV